jgi:hypothetical protein
MRVVAHYLDGRVLKGRSLDVHPNRPFCHVITRDGERVRVELGELKALFVVRSLEGNAAREDADRFVDHDTSRWGVRAVEVLFRDGERLPALTIHFPPDRQFFFLLPADADSNNKRMLVNGAAVAEMRLVPMHAPAHV